MIYHCGPQFFENPISRHDTVICFYANPPHRLFLTIFIHKGHEHLVLKACINIKKTEDLCVLHVYWRDLLVPISFSLMRSFYLKT